MKNEALNTPQNEQWLTFGELRQESTASPCSLQLGMCMSGNSASLPLRGACLQMNDCKGAGRTGFEITNKNEQIRKLQIMRNDVPFDLVIVLLHIYFTGMTSYV